MHVNVINDLERKIENYRNILINRSETLQPIIIAIGDDLFNIKEFVVFYDNIKYSFTNFISAFDCCFKICHVLNLHYPKDSLNFWMFVQKYFYDLESSHDNVTAGVLCLIQALN